MLYFISNVKNRERLLSKCFVIKEMHNLFYKYELVIVREDC